MCSVIKPHCCTAGIVAADALCFLKLMKRSIYIVNRTSLSDLLNDGNALSAAANLFGWSSPFLVIHQADQDHDVPKI